MIAGFQWVNAYGNENAVSSAQKKIKKRAKQHLNIMQNII
jgi:hypothetical protein